MCYLVKIQHLRATLKVSTMNFINYLSQRPKLTQFGIVLIVFFILMSMTGLYHDLIVERHLFAKSVDKGEINLRLVLLNPCQ